MSTAIFEAPNVGTELQRFSPTDSAIAAMTAEYMPLVIRGIDDTEGYQRVRSARLTVKDHRVRVEKVRKELKADSIEYGRRVDGEAKRITALLLPIEEHLESQENAVIAEKERIKNAARVEAERKAAEAKAAEEARIKAEQAAENERLRIEREKLDAERRAMEAERAKIEQAQAAERARQKAEQDKIDVERRKVEAEAQRLAAIEAARQRAIEMEKARAESAERARVETEQRIAREAADREAAAKAKKEAEEAAKARAEALRPDREKLLAVAALVMAIEIPIVSNEVQSAAHRVRAVLTAAAQKITAIVAELDYQNV